MIDRVLKSTYFDRFELTSIRGVFHKAFFQWQMTKISDKSADNQSETRISVAYNNNCHLSLMTSFVKHPPGLPYQKYEITF